MLQILLRVAIPLVVTLATAFIVFRTMTNDNEQGERERRPPSFGPTNATNMSASSEMHGQRRRRRRRSNLGRSIRECAVCFEDTDLVEIYPCKHREICEACINKIICDNEGNCPLCRAKIQGYTDIV